MRFLPDGIFGNGLLEVEKPARYLGGEYGHMKKAEADYRVALSFPDLYEIGMSNQAVKILYGGLNSIEGLACERVFAPDLDYEALLRKSRVPLCSLESGIPLREMDMIAFTVGYELCGTGILSILDLGGVPLFAGDRDEGHPIVIGGGMALTNPLPFSEFFDAIWIGEAEAGFFELMADATRAKRKGATRSELLAAISSHPAMWHPGKKARRAVFTRFGSTAQLSSLPVATVKPVQDHGVVEIMRGCPNGCRFCHAGYAYRPTRMKSPELILDEVIERVRIGGHREVTLSSLSSGDYSGIDGLLKGLSAAFAPDLVSFQLPSLRVSTFNLPLMESLSLVRKSGLTFAVETPRADWQSAMNKDVSREKVLEILEEARKRGWKSAKFYFMIGLPAAPDAHEEVEEIYRYLMDLHRASRFEFNVNVGVFVPKAHTPFERAAQLPENEAMDCFLSLKRRLPPRIRLSFHSPFISTLEGLVSRGDARSGRLILEAFKKGLRLEAWEEHREMDAWREVVAAADPDYLASVLSRKEEGQSLFWDCIDMGIGRRYFEKEAKRSADGQYTPVCAADCEDPCGACNAEYGKIGPALDFTEFDRRIGEYAESRSGRVGEGRFRMLFAFSKKGIGRFYPHLTVVDALSKAFARSDLPVAHTQGFNPQPKLEIAHPLAMGVESEAEIACVELHRDLPGNEFLDALNASLPEGLRIVAASCYRMKDGLKNQSLASLFGASAFSVRLSSNQSATDIMCGLESYPTVRKVEFIGESLVRCIVLTGKTKDEQPLSPFKRVFGDALSTWPQVIRNECLCAATAHIASGSISGGSETIGFPEYFASYYAERT